LKYREALFHHLLFFWIILFYDAPSTIMRTNRRLYP